MPEPDGDRYGAFAWHYDALTATSFRPGERDFYLALARPGGGPVCEPACGAGRLLAPLCEAGVEVWGTDRSAAMLDLARRRLTATGGRFRLYEQSIQGLDLPASFQAILLPLDAFRLLRTDLEQRQFLARAAEHLLPGGYLALDLTLREATLPEVVRLPALDGPDGEVTAESRWLDRGEELVEETTFRAAGAAPRVCRDIYRWVRPEDLRARLLATGWRIEVWAGDHQGTGYQSGDGMLVAVARRRDGG